MDHRFPTTVDIDAKPYMLTLRLAPDRSRIGAAGLCAVLAAVFSGLLLAAFSSIGDVAGLGAIVLGSAFFAFVLVHRPEGADINRWNHGAAKNACSEIPRRLFEPAHAAALQLVAGFPKMAQGDLDAAVQTSWSIMVRWGIAHDGPGSIRFFAREIQVRGDQGCATLTDCMRVPSVTITRRRHGRHLSALLWEEFPEAFSRFETRSGPYPAMASAHVRLGFQSAARGTAQAA